MVVDTSDLVCSELLQLNLTNDAERAGGYINRPGPTLVAVLIQGLALLIGVPGNVSFLVAVARIPYMRTVTNIFLVNLAVADIVFLLYAVIRYLLYLPAPVRSHIHSLITLWCPVSFGISFLTYFASVLTVCLVSAERYCAICKPFKHLAVNTKARAARLVLGTWVAALAFTCLAVVQYADPVRICVSWPRLNRTEEFADLPDIIGFCLPLGPWALVVGNLTASLPFLIALVVTETMYVQIVLTLSRRQADPITGADGRAGALAQRARRTRNQVTRMLVANGTVFFLCQCPYACINVSYIVSYLRGLSILEINEIQSDLRIFSHGLLFLNSAINPVIYYAMCASYRRAVVEAFGFAATKRPAALSNVNHSTDNQGMASDQL